MKIQSRPRSAQAVQAPKAPETQPLGELLTVEEVARRWRVDDTTVRRWIKAGVLKAVELPHMGDRKAYRIKRKTFEEIMGE